MPSTGTQEEASSAEQAPLDLLGLPDDLLATILRRAANPADERCGSQPWQAPDLEHPAPVRCWAHLAEAAEGENKTRHYVCPFAERGLPRACRLRLALACRRFHHMLTAPGLAGLAWEDVEYAADVADQPEFDGFLEWLLRGDAKAPKRLELSFTDEASGEEGQGEEEEPPAPVHSAAWAGLVSAGKRLGAERGRGWGWELLGSFTAGGLPAAPSARPASSQRLIWPPAFQPAPLGCCRTVTAVRGSLQDLKLDWPHQVELHSWVAGLSRPASR